MSRVVDLLESAVTSPWVYALIVAIVAVDAFFPVVPSETVVIAAAVFATGGDPALVGVAAAATIGAVLGDHVSYLVGRTASGRLLAWADRGRRRRASFAWARAALGTRGGLLLVVARYVPGGRTAMTVTMGAVDYPLRRFTPIDVVAGLTWALFCSAIGYVGGAAFEHEPIKGVALGIGLALAISVVAEITRHVRGARVRSGAAASAAPAASGAGEAQTRLSQPTPR